MPYGSFYWFRAFNRDTTPDVLDVLRTGPSPNPNPQSETRLDEIELGIPAPCVYAYLGHTLESFGQRALALRMSALTGMVSPFDSGGLLRWIKPVCEFDLAEKKDFLRTYSWQTPELPAVLAKYPGAAVGDYLAGQCPQEGGPHEFLKPGEPPVNIWNGSGNFMRAWIWEGRSTEPLEVGDKLVGWSCTPDEYLRIMDEVAAVTTEDEQEVEELFNLLGKYYRGGVSQLVKVLRQEQEALIA